MSITVTGDGEFGPDGFFLRGGEVIIDGVGTPYVETIDRILISSQVYVQPDGLHTITLRGGPLPVEITVGDTSTPGDPGAITIVGTAPFYGEIATINVESGARLISQNSAYYDAATSSVVGGYQNVVIGNSYAASVNVTGNGSSLLAYGIGSRITVGDNAYLGASLNVTDGATVGALSVFAGVGSQTYTTISGAGSRLNIGDQYGQYGGVLSTVAGGLTIATTGGTGQIFSAVAVEDGGVITISNTDGVTDAPFANIGRDAGFFGRVNVDGAGSALNITQNGDAAAGGAFLGVGRDGNGTLIVSNGGSVNVTGDNAAITVAHALNAGSTERYGQFSIETGGSVTIDSGEGDGGGLVIGQSANVGATATVDGEGSLLSVISDAGTTQSFGAFVTVGREGDGSLAITNGGDVIVNANDDILPAVQIGYGAVTGEVTVDGAGSTFTLTGNDTSHIASAGLMIVGRNAGSDGSLEITNGGVVTLSQTNSLISVANEVNSTGAITISGAGSSLTAGLITVAVDNDFNFNAPGASTANGGDGRIDVRTGGTLTAERLTIGDRGVADLTGALSTDIELHGELAFAGAADGTLDLLGDLSVEQQGTLSITISRFSTGEGDQLNIDGDADFGALSGGVDLRLGASDNFSAGDTFVFANATGTLTATTQIVTDLNTGQTFTLSASSGQLILTANESRIGDDGLFLGDENDNLLDGGEGDDTLFGFGGDDTLLGGSEDDLLIGGTGADQLDGGDGFDFVSYEDAAQRVQVDTTNAVSGIGEAAGDVFTSIEGIIGSRFNDNLRGGAEDNVIRAGTFTDRIFGRGGNDTLDGEGGADAIYGNGGADELTGGTGRDRFIYFNLRETGVGEGNRDVITDFEAAAGERMEISRFDADTTQGLAQAFDFIGTTAFSNTAGELRADQSSGVTTIVQGDVNGDGVADFEIELTGLIDLTAANFLL